MKLYIIGNVAPVSNIVEIKLPLGKKQKHQESEQKIYSNAFLINELYHLQSSNIYVLNSLEAALALIGTSACILYVVEFEKNIKEDILFKNNFAELFESNSFLKKYSKTLHPSTVITLAEKATLLNARIGNTVYKMNFELEKVQLPDLNSFIQEYKKQCASEWCVKFWGKTYKQINSNTLDNMSDVYQHAFAEPNSRTATVLAKMIIDRRLLSSDVVNLDEGKSLMLI